MDNTDHIVALSYVVGNWNLWRPFLSKTWSASHENFPECIQQEILKDMYFIEVTDYPFWWCLCLGVEFALETKFSLDVTEWVFEMAVPFPWDLYLVVYALSFILKIVWHIMSYYLSCDVMLKMTNIRHGLPNAVPSFKLQSAVHHTGHLV